jgi:hypothetical protein
VQGLDLNQRPSGYEASVNVMHINNLGNIMPLLRPKLRLLRNLGIAGFAQVAGGYPSMVTDRGAR